MPRLPALLAGLARKMGRKAVVTQLIRLSPGLLRVDLGGPELASKTWAPGSSAEFLVTPQELRHYTLIDNGDTATMLLQLHSDGPGTAWAKQLSIGDEVVMLGPGGRPWLRPGRDQLMLGDATAIGLFRALIDSLQAPSSPPASDRGDAAGRERREVRAGERGEAAAGERVEATTETNVIGAIEVPARDAEAAAKILPELDIVELRVPGEALRDWAGRLDSTVDVAYLAGHAQSLATLRKELLPGTHGRKAVVVQGYWATGKAGI